MSEDALKGFAAKLAAKRPARATEHTFTAECSGRAFTIKRLSARDHEFIDDDVISAAAEASRGKDDAGDVRVSAVSVQYRRYVVGITEIDGERVPQFDGPADVDALMEILDGDELDEIMAVYRTAFSLKGTALKNSSTPPAPDSPQPQAPSESDSATNAT